MEKINSLTKVFEAIKYVTPFRVLTSEARQAADNIPVFHKSGNGCILLMMVPLCPQADVWLGGMSAFDEDGRAIDTYEYVVARTIRPGGSHTIQWEDPTDYHIEPVNCLAYAMMKIAYLSHLVKDGILARDYDEAAKTTGYYVEANGYSSHRGAVCTTICYDEQPLMRLYVAFSGATEDEDLQCARRTVQKFCAHLHRNCSQLTFITRGVDGIEHNELLEEVI